MDLPSHIITEKNSVKLAFKLLNDQESREEYLAQLRLQLWLGYDDLPLARQEEQYFNEEFFTPMENEVFVDCGAFTGDTIESYISHQGVNFRKIIAFEPDPQNFTRLSDFISTLPSDLSEKIVPLEIAVGSIKGRVNFNVTGTISSAINDQGSLSVECTPLDEVLIDSNPTIIKMDIEGGELDALVGCKSTIIQKLPILIICVYHKQNHLWRIPEYIHSLSDKYRFFLRRYSYGNEFWELICYAIPDYRLQRDS